MELLPDLARGRGVAGAVLAGVVAVACSSAPAPGASSGAAPAPSRPPASAATPAASPAPVLAPYSIDALRRRGYGGGRIAVGPAAGGGPGYQRHAAGWPSQGGVMTGVIDIPDGPGPFPVVVVNHGFVPPAQYYVGQDSSKYADQFAADGWLTVSPDYPGYAGSGPPAADLAPIEAEAVSDMDLIASLGTLPQADPHRVSVVGHSNGGGVAELVMVIDPHVRSVVLYAPVSSDMADNARRWWLHAASGSGTGPLGDPASNPQGYAQISPRNYLRPGGPPVLILQGTDDEDIPAPWTEATVAALQSAGIPTGYVVFPAAHHNLVGADLGRANQLAEDWMRGR